MENKKWPTQELESTVIKYIKMLNMQQKGESFGPKGDKQCEYAELFDQMQEHRL